MKKIILLIIISLLSSVSMGLAAEESHHNHDHSHLESEDFVKIRSDISWSILQEFDLLNNKASVDLQKKLNTELSLTGYMIPIDYSQIKVSEFLLVPFYSSCGHAHGPQANQVVRVKMKELQKVKILFGVVRVYGKLSIQAHRVSTDPKLPPEAFKMTAVKLEKTTPLKVSQR